MRGALWVAVVGYWLLVIGYWLLVIGYWGRGRAGAEVFNGLNVACAWARQTFDCRRKGLPASAVPRYRS
ncbi:MAG: hypothetical protein D6781_01480 [Verrucomicrobia bacterium]|nr:MAG: hypothetical protein D6781_01480 [Verrucomicrobiota bacterium]